MPVDRLIHPRLGHSQKVTSLSHLEARVWQQYLLSADDFGVMQYAAVTIQSGNDALARESSAVIQSSLNRLIEVGLVCAFTHQHNQYLYQRTWQDYQKILYPRMSVNPKPPTELLATCSSKTQELFRKYPGGYKPVKDKSVAGDGFHPTQDELKRGRQWRHAFGRCPHDSPCKTIEYCIGVQIRRWRDELQGT